MKVFKKVLKYFIILLFWIGVWELSALAVGQELFLPTPFSVIACGAKLIFTSLFWRTIWVTVIRIILGTLLAILGGTLLALITSRTGFLYDLFYPMLTIIKATPVASFITLAIIWMGLWVRCG